jgi:hypothetical protein
MTVQVQWNGRGGMEEVATKMQADLESDIAGARSPAHWIVSQPAQSKHK